MPGLTVTEKEHWKERIARRIDKRIEVLAAVDPNLMDRVQRQARQRALQSLGMAEMQAELDAVVAKQAELLRREEHAHRAMLAKARGVPVDGVDDCHARYAHREVTDAVERRQAVHEEDLLAQEEQGKEILRLRHEKDDLLDTVWLATSTPELRSLWQKVADLLGDEPTPLQKQALAIQPPGNA